MNEVQGGETSAVVTDEPVTTKQASDLSPVTINAVRTTLLDARVAQIAAALREEMIKTPVDADGILRVRLSPVCDEFELAARGAAEAFRLSGYFVRCSYRDPGIEYIPYMQFWFCEKPFPPSKIRRFCVGLVELLKAIRELI